MEWEGEATEEEGEEAEIPHGESEDSEEEDAEEQTFLRLPGQQDIRAYFPPRAPADSKGAQTKEMRLKGRAEVAELDVRPDIDQGAQAGLRLLLGDSDHEEYCLKAELAMLAERAATERIEVRCFADLAVATEAEELEVEVAKAATAEDLAAAAPSFSQSLASPSTPPKRHPRIKALTEDEPTPSRQPKRARRLSDCMEGGMFKGKGENFDMCHMPSSQTGVSA